MSKSPTGAPRRVAVGLLAGALSVFGIALAPPAGATIDAVFDRVAGATRYGTAGAVATEAYPDGNDCVIIATGERFPDSLAASGLAGAMECPILLVQLDDVPDETAAAIGELNATQGTIVGGTSAVSQDVEDSLEADHGLTVNRVAGTDRYETAAEIADAIDAIGTSEVAIVASGEVAADAQSAGPVAAALDAPILLATTNDVPAATSAALAGRTDVLIAGGTARISDSTEEDIEAASDDDDATRLAGLDRQATARIIAEYAVTTLGWAPTTAMLAAPNAPNDDFSPDALVAGPLGGIRQAPTLIIDTVDNLGEDAETFLDAHSDTIEEVLCIGGTAVISDEVCAAAEAAARNTENDPATGGDTQTSSLLGPELQSCSITGLDLDDAEVVVSYVFDADVETADESLFKIYNADTRNPIEGNAEGEEADVAGDTVDIIYSLADYAILDARLCAVETGAVEDEDGNLNPPQSLEINGAPELGGKQGGDLVSAELTDEDDDEYTFTFDAAVSNLAEPALEVVFEDGTDVDCSGESTDPADESSTEVTATCTTADNNDPVRGIATFTGANGDVVIQAVAIASGGDSDGPDLDSVIFASENDDLGADEVIFVFDEALDTPNTGSATFAESFGLSYSHCDPTTSNGFDLANPCAVEGDTAFFDATPNDDNTGDNEAEALDLDDNEILVRFPTDSVNEFLVGAFVSETAAIADDDADAATSKDDAVVVDQDGWDAGDVAGPQLIGVSAVIDDTASGAFQDFEVTYTFDIEIDDDGGDINGAFFSVWFEDGDGDVEEYEFADADCEADEDNTVVCTDTDDESDIGSAVVGSVDWDAVQSDATYTTSDQDATSFAMPNPEGSAAFEAPGFPEEDE